MTRFALIALLLPLAAPVLADEMAENCAATAGIVADAVNMRADGKDAADTTAFLGSPESGFDARFRKAAPMLVEWVYTLPEEQLTEAASQSFEAACLEQG